MSTEDRDAETVTELRAELERAKAELAFTRGELESARLELEVALEQQTRTALRAEFASIELLQLFNASQDASWVVDRDFRVIRVNDAMLALAGKDRDEVLGARCRDVFAYGLCDTDDCPVTRLVLRKGTAQMTPDVQTGADLESSRVFLSQMTRYRALDGEVLGIVGSFKDITARRRAEVALAAAHRDLERISVTDGLTQIANRRHFDETLEREWRRAARAKTELAVVLCDVDHFKLYNDTYGHQAGDECLRRVAAVLRDAARRPADLAARYGGEEFVLVLPETTLAGACAVAETVRRNVAALGIPHERSSAAPCVTISLGVAAQTPSPGASAAELVAAADRALYEAKRGGRNRWCQGTPMGGPRDAPLR